MEKKAVGDLVLSTAANVTFVNQGYISDNIAYIYNNSNILLCDSSQNDANYKDSSSENSNEFDMKILDVNDIFG